MRKYNFILMAFALLLGMAQCKKEPATPNGDNNGGVRITLKVDDGPSTPSTPSTGSGTDSGTDSGTESGTDDGEKLNVYPATGAVIFTQGDKIYVGNNGKYVGTLTFDNGLFQGTINDDLCSTTDYLHFYFVGNKPTSPATLTASTTTYTVNISDQSTGLPAISYAPSTAKYSPSTTAYTAKLLNKSALVKFVPSTATSQLITVSGMKNNVTIDFEHNTLAPTGTTGGITLYSVSDTEKWAILLPQDAVPSAAVTGIGFTAENIAVPTITDNMYYNSGIGISMTAVYETYVADNSNWSTVLASFNAEPTFNPMLKLTEDININNNQFAITRANGTIDLNGFTLESTGGTRELFLQNNVLGESLTITNGTINAPVDGNVNWDDWYCGTVIFENITFKKDVFFDGHRCELTNVDFAAGSKFENYTGGTGNPGLVIINSGKFNCAFHGNGDIKTKGATTIYGGKFSTNPSSIANVTIPEGYSIRSNTDSDSGTYPYVVKALTEPYEITSSSSDPSVVSFNNAASTPTPTLHFNTDYGDGLTITRANGIVDFNGHSANELFIKNNVLGESITLQNGTIGPKPIDGESGTSTSFKGTVILENMTVNGRIYTDGHAYVINSGTYYLVQNDYRTGYPSTVVINGGKFREFYSTTGQYTIYGGKYSFYPSNSNNVTIPSGYSVKSNTDNDAATYPWIVSADAPVVSYPEGAINGKFTINSNGDQVYFSKGNLQYKASSNTWQFATNQYDFIGSDNSNISQNYSGWIDLFGWGTSGWSNGNVYYQPYDTQNNGNSNQGYGYGPTNGTSYTYNLTGTYANADWGVYNPISNGGNTTNTWRTLTGGSNGEWEYIFDSRSTPSGIRYAKAQVNGVSGVILLPDDWSASYYSLNNTNQNSASFGSNVISSTLWSTLEQHGAVFLPAAGYRSGSSVYNVGSDGNYWSASYSSSNYAYGVLFYDSGLNPQSSGRYSGYSVRLVRNVE